MKTSARRATLFILLFFIFFNTVQGYLIFQRIAGAKAKFSTVCTNALLATLFQYNKLKEADSIAKPKQSLIAYSLDDIAVNRLDSQNITISSPSSRLYAIRTDPASVEGVINRPRPVSLNRALLDSLYGKALDSFKIQSKFRLDTFAIITRTGNDRVDLSQQINNTWTLKRKKEYPFSTNPQRMFFYPGSLVFAELKNDNRFFWKELFWPMLAFFFILLISNTALVFVYKTIRKQKRINEVKTDFINNMTHEMKTPITIASAGLDALELHVPPTERSNFYLHTSRKQLQLLNDFVERILEAAVQDIPDLSLKKEKTDLLAVFTELISGHSVPKEKSVNFQLTGEGPVFVYGDRLHLETAFHNIIDNAIKYSNGSVDITIAIAENSRDCSISIRDNGMGIPPEYLKNIFEKFFRVPKGDAQRIKGFGLGLYYVSNIIKKHAGSISVQSKLRSGTEFVITLPKQS